VARAGLSRDQVVCAAAEYVDAQGCDRLTITAVADRVGVRPPSLYKHIENLDDLRFAISAFAYRELERRLRAAIEGTDRPLVDFAYAYRRFAHDRPGLAATTGRSLPGYEEQLRELEAAALEPLLRLIYRHGIRDDRGIHVARFVRSALHGFVTIEAASGFRLPESIDESFTSAIDALDLVLTRSCLRRQFLCG